MNAVISPDCMSTTHNSLNSAYSKRGRPACTCPHALALLENERERQRARTKADRAARGEETATAEKRGAARIPRWQKIAGHYPIDPACPAKGHNTLSWARGGHSGKGAHCICAQAKRELEQHAEKRRTQRRVRTQIAAPLRKPVPAMDFSRGLCTERRNLQTVEGGFDTRTTWTGFVVRERAKDLCRGTDSASACPLLAECRAWIKEAEQDAPGSLGGVYGGMDPWDRRGITAVLVNGKWRRNAAA